MNLREAVVCQRLRVLSRGKGFPPATEEDVRAIEEQLGFTLPAMLRTVYLSVSNGGARLGLYGVPISSHEEPSNDPSQEAYLRWLNNYHLAPPTLEESDSEVEPLADAPAAPVAAFNLATSWAYLEALRQHPGAYCSWDELGFPEGLPTHWVYLARYADSLWVLLDGDTGDLYFQEAEYYPQTGEDWSKVSFCAPSVEDWLERELDASSDVRLRYQPHRKLTDVLADGIAHIEQPRPSDVSPEVREERTELSKRQARLETDRLREENLGDDGPDPVEEAARTGIRYPSPITLQVKHVGWELEQARHQILRQLYRLMELLESVAHAQNAADTNQRDAWNEGAMPEGLEALIDADAHLALMTDQIQRGSSHLFQLARTKPSLGSGRTS